MFKDTGSRNSIIKSFKKLMKLKPFKEITVIDIAKNSGHGRVVFYYYFQDKYDLLNKIFHEDIILPFMKDLSHDNWNQKLLEMFKSIAEESFFYENAMQSPCRSEFIQFLKKEFINISYSIAENIDDEKNVSPNDKNFNSEFFAYCFSGTLINWILNGMKDPEILAEQFNKMINNYTSIIQSFCEERNRSRNAGEIRIMKLNTV